MLQLNNMTVLFMQSIIMLIGSIWGGRKRKDYDRPIHGQQHKKQWKAQWWSRL